MDRRRFLQRGLVGGALLALAGAGLGLRRGARVADPIAALRVLDASAFQVLVAVARRVVTAPEADHVAIAHAVDQGLIASPREAQEDVRSVLHLFENALPGLLFDGRTAPFTTLGPDAQDQVLAAWRDSRFVLRRSGYQALRRLCLATHYGGTHAWRRIRYGGPPQTGGFFLDDSQAGTAAWLARAEEKTP